MTIPQLYKFDGGKYCRCRPQDCPCRPPHEHRPDSGTFHAPNFKCNAAFNRRVSCVPCDKRGRIKK